MPTHFNDRIPKEPYIKKWFIFNAYYAPHKTITPQMVIKILDAGYTRIYVSMGAKYADEQMEIQKKESFIKSLELLQGRSFELVVIDCINAPFQTISNVLPSVNNIYLMGENLRPFYKESYNSWNGKCQIPRLLHSESSEIKILNEFRNGPFCTQAKSLEIMNKCWFHIL